LGYYQRNDNSEENINNRNIKMELTLIRYTRSIHTCNASSGKYFPTSFDQVMPQNQVKYHEQGEYWNKIECAACSERPEIIHCESMK
jgi:hypothetical protein